MADETTSKNGMSQSDVEFLIACLKNTNGGSISVDSQAVASALGYNNPRSVSNRLSALKKKYDLPLGNSSNGTATKAKTSGTTSGPTTPSKNRVEKKKATPRAKKGTPTTNVEKSSGEPAMEDEETPDEHMPHEAETEEQFDA